MSFRWQLDDDPGQLHKTNSPSLDHLANGPHLLKVTAIDDQLNMDASPADAKFKTRIDPHQQRATLLAVLGDSDFSKRQEAVNALAHQPELALPALRQARKSTNDGRYWLVDRCRHSAV